MAVHTASETNVDKCETQKEQAWKINVEGTRNIAEACKKLGAKLVCVSTDYVFDGEKATTRNKTSQIPSTTMALQNLKEKTKLPATAKTMLSYVQALYTVAILGNKTSPHG